MGLIPTCSHPNIFNLEKTTLEDFFAKTKNLILKNNYYLQNFSIKFDVSQKST